jgi:type 1 glutamine amidotransferase
MRILVFCDDYWHPASTPRIGLKGLEQKGFQFDWIEDANDWPVNRLTKYPVVILTKANNISSVDQTPWVTKGVQDIFLDYVQRGNAILAIHSGIAGYEQLPIMRALMGGAFREHPDQCMVTIEPQPGHQLCAGCIPFTLMDEHYFIDLDDDQAEVFTTTSSEYGTQPGGWIRFEGQGKICVIAPGHNLQVWEHPSFQTLLTNVLLWCGDKKR